jgi:hypothetical protein
MPSYLTGGTLFMYLGHRTRTSLFPSLSSLQVWCGHFKFSDMYSCHLLNHLIKKIVCIFSVESPGFYPLFEKNSLMLMFTSIVAQVERDYRNVRLIILFNHVLVLSCCITSTIYPCASFLCNYHTVASPREKSQMKTFCVESRNRVHFC